MGREADRLECLACTRENKWICDLHSRWVEAGEPEEYRIVFRSDADGDWYLQRVNEEK